MNPKIKNIILFTVIAIVMISIYVLFIKKEPEQANLVTFSSEENLANNTIASTRSTLVEQADPQIAKDFLSILLSVKNISLDDSIFTDIAFISLRDSSILLVPLGDEGRPNPFAPIGTEINTTAINNSLNSSTPATNNSEILPVSPLTDTPDEENTNNSSTGGVKTN